MKNRMGLVLGVVAVAGIAGFGYWMYQAKQDNAVVAQVGSHPITQKDVKRRFGAMKILNPQMRERVAADQLIRAYQMSEVLKTVGQVSMEEALQRELDTFNKRAQSQNKIGEVKKFFGSDTQALKDLFLLPMVIDRVAYLEGYLKDSDFHSEKKKEAQELLKEAQQKNGSLEKLAKAKGFMWLNGRIDAENGLFWTTPKERSLAQIPSGKSVGLEWKETIFKDLKKGQFAPEVFEKGNAWIVVKNKGPESKSDKGLGLEAVFVPKEPFGKWLDQYKDSVTVKKNESFSKLN